MKAIALLLVGLSSIACCHCFCLGVRNVRQADQIVFDNDLPDHMNNEVLNRIAEQPVRYQPFTYNKKYFIEDAVDSTFTYDQNSPRSPRIWARSFPNCGGIRQSPINLRTENCLRKTLSKPLQHMDPTVTPENVIMENNGFSVEYTFEYQGPRPMLNGGPLRSTYVFEQLHFHWGTNGEEGSEHYINSQVGELEMHLVHRNVKYANISEATRNSDGIVVMAVLFKADPNAPDRPYMRNLDDLRQMNSSHTIRGFPPGFRMDEIVGPLTQRFIAYQGSLTTPPCHEAVSWLVAEEMQSISTRDINNFRRIIGQTGSMMAPNYRPLQDRNSRMCLSF